MNFKFKISNLKLDKGFTLIELLVVIGIMAILIVIVAVAIDVPRRFAETNDTKRLSDIRYLKFNS